MSEKVNSKLQEVSQVFKELGSTIGIVNKDLGKTFETLSAVSKAISNIKETTSYKVLTSGVELCVKKNKELKEKIERVFNELYTSVMTLKKEFETEGLKGMFKNLSDQLKDFGKELKSTFSEAKGRVKGLGDDIKNAFASIKNNPFKALSESISTFSAAAAGVFTVGVAGGIVLATTAIAGFIAYFKHLMETNEEFNAKITELWSNVTEAFQPAIDAFGELFACLVTGRETVDSEGNAIMESFITVATVITETLATVVGSIAEVISGIASFIKEIMFTTADETEGKTITTWQVITEAVRNAWEVLKEIFGAGAEVISAIWGTVGDELVEIFATVWETIGHILNGAVEVISGVMDIVSGLFTWNGDKILTGFRGVVEGIKDSMLGITGFFSGIWNTVSGTFKSIAVTIADGVGNSFRRVINNILDYVGSAINSFIRSINGAIGLINEIPGVYINRLSTISIPKLASGGIVTPGQLFLAREAGPELVGNFGARTAVMNNNQIVESVSRGVYAAVKEAMSSGSPITLNINNQLDGRCIGKQVIKYHNGVVKQTGSSPLLI